MATGRVPTTANSPLTAKGDLFGYSTAPARLAVGNDGEQIVADSSASTGLRYTSNFAAGKNAIINGDFRIWQRGTSFSNPNSVYTADRFLVGNSTAVPTSTASQQTFTPGTAPMAGYEGATFYRLDVTNQGSSTGQQIITRLEDVRLFAGQTVTFSFWAKADASRTLGAVKFGQNFGSGGSGAVETTITLNSTALTTSWTRYSGSISVPSISGKTVGTSSYVYLLITPPTTTYTLDTWGWQLEAGSVATAFQTATGTIQGELAACQRYFYRFGGLVNNEYFAIGTSVSAGTAIGYASPKVSLRGTPTLSFTTASNYRVIEGTSQTTATSVNAEELSANNISFAFNASGFTIGRANRMNANNTTNGYIDISAEL